MDKRSGDRNLVSALPKSSRSGAKTPFVGRDEELRRLSMALDLAADGQGGAIFLTGQPGIGKTRLAREALALAKQRGFRVLQGRSYPHQAGLAYAPVVDAFRPLLRSFDSTQLESLVSGLPDLGHLLGGIRLPVPSMPLEGIGNPALEKTRLYEAMLRLAERLTQESPLVLFVDDIHWADPASLDLLHYLARGLSDQRILLLATCNVNSLNTSRSLRAMLRSLQRDGLAEEIVVLRMERDAVGKLVKGILDDEAPEDLLSLIDARAGGTPLFVEALIAALVDSGNLRKSDGIWAFDPDGALALPQSVRHLILERLERLAPSQRRILDLLAIMGDATSHAILRVASSLEEEALLDALQRLRAKGLVSERVDGPDVVYRIVHPLIQEVAYAELPEMVRRHSHVSAIKAFERMRPEDISHLARHYRGAGQEADQERALVVLMEAGKKALAVYANEEAAQYFETALVLLKEGLRRGQGIGFPPDPCLPTPNTLPWLLEQLGEAWERIGKRGVAVEIWNEALAERQRTGDVLGASRLRNRLAFMEWDRGRFDVAFAHLQAGLTELAGDEPNHVLVGLHSLRFHFLGRLGDKAGMADSAKELLSLAGRLASPQVEADANLVASIVSMEQSDVTTARERALHALKVSEEAQDLWNNCRAHAVMAVIGMRLGDHRLIRHHAELGLAVARRLGAPNYEVLLRLRLTYANFLSGAWDEARRCSIETIALYRRVGHPRDLAYALAERAMVLALQGDSLEAEACVSEVQAVFGSASREGAVDRYIFGLVDITETALALERGQVERALSIANDFVRPPTSALLGRVAGLTLESVPLGLMLLAEVQVAAGKAEEALATAGKLIDLGPSDTPYLTALASRAEGLARLALGQPVAAVACLARANESFTALELPFEGAKCLLEKATAALQGRVTEPDKAAIAAQQSLVVFDRLGARSYIERARQLLRKLGISPPPVRRTRPSGIPLSEREIEVARLVADGLTTAEIGERLVLSPFTINTHLRHIYSRLGIGSRAALARYVIEAGLHSPTENT